MKTKKNEGEWKKGDKIKRIPYYLNLNLMRRSLFILIYSLQFYCYWGNEKRARQLPIMSW